MLLALLLPLAAGATTFPTGTNFRVNAVSDGFQRYPSVGAGGGQFVVVWVPNNAGIVAQRLDASGARVGGELTVSNSGTDPAVAVGPAGDFAVVWDTSSGGIRARLFDAAGTPQGADFAVSAGVNVGTPAIAADGLGNYIVSWTDFSGFGPLSEIFARRYDATGSPLSGEFHVNTTIAYRDPSGVAADGAGNFVVVWQSFPPDVFAQRYDSAGTPLGAEFLVNTYTTFNQNAPAVARAAGGDFVVAWVNEGGQGISAQRFDAGGNPLGSEFTVGNPVPYPREVDVATDAAGDFVVTSRDFASFYHDTIRAARFESDGTPQGGELQVNLYTGAQRDELSVAGDGAGNFLVVWHDDIGDDVIAQRFSGACGDGTLDSGEVCDDGNNSSGDGCETNCLVQTCFTCAGAPSSCTPIAACVTGDGCCAPGCTPATDHDCTTLVSGSQLLIRNVDNGPDLLTFKSRDAAVDTTPGTGIDPVADGAFLHVYNAAGGGKSICHELRTMGSALWEIRGTTPTGPVLAYNDNDYVVSRCKLARVRDGQLLRVKCVEPGYILGNTQGSMAVRFTSGPSAICSVFGGVRRDNVDIFLASRAPAPASCPMPPVPCPPVIPAGP
jgi:cysteine-rich repeat protein